MTGREAAWRVFAHEFQASVESEAGSGDRPVRHVLSPLGARMNRLLAVGTLGVPEPVGRDPTAPFLKARLSDPTGAFSVTAGGFQPRALQSFQAIQEPRRHLVVGKAHLFTGRDGVSYSSIRAESVRPISEGEYAGYLEVALDHTLQRIELLGAVRDGRAAATAGEAARAGIPPLWWIAAGRASTRYPRIDLAPFRGPLQAVVREIESIAGATSPVAGTARVTRARPAVPMTPPSAADRAAEASFLDIIDELAERSADGYADLRETLALAEQRALHGDRAEELLHALEESGVLEEPVVGKLRRA